MNSAFYVETMVTDRERITFELLDSTDEKQKLNYKVNLSSLVFSANKIVFVISHAKKCQEFMTEPVCLRLRILGFSKLLMFENY